MSNSMTMEDAKALPKIKELPTICGIYFLFRGEQLVYVGQSVNIYVRVYTHKQQKKKEFDSFSYIECDEQQLNKIEAELIARFDPEYNATMAPGFGFYSLNQWAEAFDVPLSLLKSFISTTNLMPLKKWYSREEVEVFAKFMDFALGSKWKGRRKRINPELLRDKVQEFLIKTREQ